MGLEQGLNLVATTMNNSVDSPKTNTEIMVISSNEIRNLTSDELENLYNSVQVPFSFHNFFLNEQEHPLNFFLKFKNNFYILPIALAL